MRAVRFGARRRSTPSLYVLIFIRLIKAFNCRHRDAQFAPSLLTHVSRQEHTKNTRKPSVCSPEIQLIRNFSICRQPMRRSPVCSATRTTHLYDWLRFFPSRRRKAKMRSCINLTNSNLWTV